MIDHPPERELAQFLQEHWSIDVAAISPLGKGRSRNTCTLVASSANRDVVIKVKQNPTRVGLEIAQLLQQSGVSVVAPTVSNSGRLSEPFGSFDVSVHSFAPGGPVDMSKLSEEDWRSLGEMLRAVHDTWLPDRLNDALPMETCEPEGMMQLHSMQSSVYDGSHRRDTIQEAFLQMWSHFGSVPMEFFELVRSKGRRALLSKPRFCLCHGDFQEGNILRSDEGVITLIDWENPLCSPPETDLKFIAPAHRRGFEVGYGSMDLNEAVLEFQEANWVLQEALDCAERILIISGTDLEEKRWAFDLGQSMLQRMKLMLA